MQTKNEIHVSVPPTPAPAATPQTTVEVPDGTPTRTIIETNQPAAPAPKEETGPNHV